MNKREQRSKEIEEANAQLISQFINDGEQFRDVIGYEGVYKIGNKGHIISYTKPYPYVLKPWLDSKKKYYMVTLPDKQGKRCRFLVHRLVAETFIENSDNFPQVNHKDHDTHNNKADNLEWCTASYNTLHSYETLPPDRNRVSCILVFPDGHTMKFESYADVQRYREEHNLPFGKHALNYYGKSKGYTLIKCGKTFNGNRDGIKVDLPLNSSSDKEKGYE